MYVSLFVLQLFFDLQDTPIPLTFTFKKGYKRWTNVPRIKVSRLVVMFFNGMDMDKLLYKRQSNLETEKSLRVKWDICVKLGSICAFFS